MAKEMTETEIVSRVEEKAKNSVNWYNDKLALESERTLAYYNAEYPKRSHAGSSSYVSSDVYDSVEMMRAQVLEVFAGGENVAKFDPDEEMDPRACEAATEYCRWTLYRANDGHRVFSDVIHNGLLHRAGIVKVYWDECYTTREEAFEGIDEQSVMAFASRDDVAELEADQGEDGTYSGTATVKIDRSKVCIDVLAPEEFLISRSAKDIPTSDYCGHRSTHTLAKLRKDYGSKADEINTDSGTELSMTPQKLARDNQVAATTNLSGDEAIQKDMDLITVYESYVRLVLDKKKGERLYRIVTAHGTLLDKEEVDKAPFIPFVPLPVPHLFFGNNFAQRVIPYQNARTVLTRGVLDHTAITTNPKYAVVKGGLVNPQELLENRLGGIVNVRSADSVQPMLLPNLNPFIFEVLNTLKQNKEESTGISSLSQGLNKDAISSQNATALVDQLVTLSAQRQKIIARNFAYSFLVPLMVEIVRLAIANEKPERVIDIAGQPITVQPRKWTERTSCTVSFHLGYGERDKTVNEMMGAYKGMAEDPGLHRLFGEKKRYKMATDIMRLRGWSNYSEYLDDPEKLGPPEPPQPDPIALLEAQAKDKAATAQLIKAGVEQQSAQTEAGTKMLDAEQKKIDSLTDAAFKQQDLARKDFEVAHRTSINEREMDLAEKTDKKQAYIAPRN